MIPTLFIGTKREDIIFWEFCNSPDILMEYIPEICSYELFEAYQNIVEALKQRYPRRKFPQIQLTVQSLKRIQRDQLYLSGESMGLAWLIGILFYLRGKKFPNNLYAWGAIKPIRNGDFSLFPTANTKRKIQLAEKNSKNVIIIHYAERGYKLFSGDVYRLKPNLTEAINLLDKLINAY